MLINGAHSVGLHRNTHTLLYAHKLRFASMAQSYQTIAQPAQSLFKDRGSKFIGWAFPVASTAEVKEHLAALKSEHPSARHVCYAYMLGRTGDEYRANDDGEPSGTAGLPILNQIKSKEVTHVLVAVVRYFGGTKLGASGLIHAYKETAKAALSNARVITKVPTSVVKIRFPHSSTGEVERIIRQHQWKIKNQSFGMDCVWEIETALDQPVEGIFLAPIQLLT